jgi:hypothetical protein
MEFSLDWSLFAVIIYILVFGINPAISYYLDELDGNPSLFIKNE